MKIIFASKKLKKQAESEKELTRSYGKEKAYKIIQRLIELNEADSLQDIQRMPQTGLHPLKNNRKGQFSINSKQPYRIIFIPLGEFDIEQYITIKEVKILSLNEDYH